MAPSPTNDTCEAFMSCAAPGGFPRRGDFLSKARYAAIEDHREFTPTGDGSAVAANVLIALGLAPGPPTCEARGATYKLNRATEAKWKRFEDGRDLRRVTYYYQYQAPRPKRSRPRGEARCGGDGKCPPTAAGTHPRRTHTHMWPDWLDFVVSWNSASMSGSILGPSARRDSFGMRFADSRGRLSEWAGKA